MVYISTILNQLISMVIYAAVGYILHATGLVSKEGCKAFSTLLLYVILPCVIINSFLRDATPEETYKLVITLGLSVLLLVLSMLVSRLFFRQKPLDNFSASFSNAGFMGIPLIAAMLGSDAIFYVAGLVAMLNILQWTYGQYILGEKKQARLRGILLNPLVISFLVGLLLYSLPVSLPTQMANSVRTISNCNGPIAMFILGFYLKELPLKCIFTLPAAYGVAAVRLVLIPMLSILVMTWIPSITHEIKMALLVAACAPVGTNIAIYAQRLGHDYHRAVIMICLSTVLSLATMPLMLGLMMVLIG